jgi:hypothetical protein
LSEPATLRDDDQSRDDVASEAPQIEGTFTLHPFDTAVLFFYGVYVPLGTLWLTMEFRPFDPQWQSGTLAAHAALYLWPEAIWPFYPLIAAAIVGFTLLLYFPKRFIGVWYVRMALYSGVPIAMFLAVIAAINVVPDPGSLESLIGTFIAIVMALGLFAVIRMGFFRTKSGSRYFSTRYRVLVTIGTSFSLTIVYPFFFMSMVASPLTTLTAYGLLTSHIIRCRGEPWRFSLARFFAAMTWGIAILAAWRETARRAAELYSKLPTHPPQDCYVCTAAANGHARFVGSWQVPTDDGRSRCVNRQLQRIKLAELATARRLPRVHRYCRAVYDRLGPGLARSIRNPYLADLAYVALKPCEWAARLWVLFI